MNRVVLATAIVALSLVPTLQASPLVLNTCPFPNGSDTALHYYPCETGTQITVKQIKVKNDQGVDIYPLDPKVPMVLDLISYNNGAPITDNKADVQLFAYQEKWGTHTCDWSEVPTLGLLNNIDGCDYAKNCPLKSGDLTLVLPLDLHKFANIINMLAANKPYQLEIHVKNYSQGDLKHEDIACIVAQIRLI